MKTYRVFHEADLKEIHPQGWLKHFLEIQRDGLTGHPEASGYPFDAAWWGVSDEEAGSGKPGYHNPTWGPYEQTGYWIDGALRCGYLLHDPTLIEKARQPVDYVLAHPDEDGYLGPASLKKGETFSRWPHAVFFRAVLAHYSATGDKAVLSALTRHYLSHTCPHNYEREVCNIETMLYVAEKTDNDELRRMALRAYEEYNDLCKGNDNTVETMLSEKRNTEHGVTYNEIGKLGAIAYMYSGNQRYLDATLNGFRKLERDQVLIDGVNSSTEAVLGKDPLDSHETCVISDHSWALGYLLMATGDAQYADQIEKACFNALPGAVTSDFSGLQYFSCPNQVVATGMSNHNEHFKGFTWMSYRPCPGTECCAGDVHRAIPNFTARLWMKTEANGLAAVLYSPASITTQVGTQNTPVTVTEETAYPFEETITFKFHTPQPVDFPFTFRIPGWCKQAKVSFNGKILDIETKAGTFVTLEQTFNDGDQLDLELPMALRLSYWPKHGIGVERGPLVYALKIAERWEETSDQDPISELWRTVPGNQRSLLPKFPARNLHAASPWNYALQITELTLEHNVQIIKHPMSDTPFSPETAPIELKVPARRVAGWEVQKSDTLLSNFVRDSKNVNYMITDEIEGNFELTPDIPFNESIPSRLSPELETVTLIPYGCTHLRISIFPQVRAKGNL